MAPFRGALITVETYLGQPANAVSIASAAEYFQSVTSARSGADGVIERGIRAGRHVRAVLLALSGRAQLPDGFSVVS